MAFLVLLMQLNSAHEEQTKEFNELKRLSGEIKAKEEEAREIVAQLNSV